MLVAEHRSARNGLKESHEKRWIAETKTRSDRLPKGLKAAWFKLSGQYSAIVKSSEIIAQNCSARDQAEFQKLIKTQLTERRELENEFHALRHEFSVADYDPDQPLYLSDETQKLFTAKQIRKRPERILQIITDKNETFSRKDTLILPTKVSILFLIYFQSLCIHFFYDQE